MSEEVISVDSLVKDFTSSKSETPKDKGEPAKPQPESAPNPEGEPISEPDAEILDEPDAKTDAKAEVEAADEATDDDEPSEDIFEVKLPDGKAEKLTKKQLLEGYLRQSDYSRNMNAEADKRKGWEAESAQIRQHQVAVLNALVERYHQDSPVARLTAKMKEAEEIGDDATALKLRLDIQDTQKAMEQNQRALAWEQEQDRIKAENTSKQYVAEQSEQLRARLPWIEKPEGQKKFQSTISKAMDKLGYTPEEISEISRRPNHKQAIAHYYAGKYLESLDSKPAVATALKGKAVAPSTGARTGTKNGKLDNASRQFDRNPTIDSLVSVYQAHKG